MISLMTRSFADFHRLGWPADVACIVNGVPRTYTQIRAERKRHQVERLQRKLRYSGSVRQAAMLWVFYVPGPIYGGWHMYIRTLKHSWWVRDRTWSGSPEEKMITVTMQMFPCGLLPLRENFYEWKQVFASWYATGRKRGSKPQGIVWGWVKCRQDGGFPDVFIPAKRVQR